MKKLRITVEGRAFDVTVEVIEDDGAQTQAPTTNPDWTPRVGPHAVAEPPAPIPAPAPLKGAPVSSKPAVSGDREVLSQVSGVVVSVNVSVGERVSEGQQLIAIEAMKMNTYVFAPVAGKVTDVLVSKGSSVLTGDVLVRLV
jgi:biotin carboxyl carrier protein